MEDDDGAIRRPGPWTTDPAEAENAGAADEDDGFSLPNPLKLLDGAAAMISSETCRCCLPLCCCCTLCTALLVLHTVAHGFTGAAHCAHCVRLVHANECCK